MTDTPTQSAALAEGTALSPLGGVGTQPRGDEATHTAPYLDRQ